MTRQAVFQALYELDPEAQEAYLANLKEENPDLYGDIQSFLAELEMDEDSGFMDGPAAMYADEVARGAFGFKEKDNAMEKPYPSFPVFSRYTIEQQLNSGGMGAVYVSLQKGLNRKVALKVPHYVQDENALRRFVREGEIIARLTHPNVVRVYDAGIEHGRAYMAMEWIQGDNLEERIQKVLPPIEQVIQWGISLAEALSYVHSQQILHRDIKNQNIIINHLQQPILVDFGIAQNDAMTRLTLDEEAFMGTFYYACPESFESKPLTDRSDIYSLGVVLYRCLTGSYPYAGDSIQAFMHSLLHTQHASLHAINPAIPSWLSQVIDTCLEKNPDHRFQSADALLQALEAQSLNAFSSVKDKAKPIPENDENAAIKTHPSKAASKQVNQNKKATAPRIISLRSILIGVVLSVLIASGLWTVSSGMFDSPTSSSVSSPPVEQIPPPIESLLEVETPQALESLLQAYRNEVTLTYGRSPSNFSDPDSCYIVVYNAEGVHTVLSPENDETQRIDLNTRSVLTESWEASFESDYAFLWVLLF